MQVRQVQVVMQEQVEVVRTSVALVGPEQRAALLAQVTDAKAPQVDSLIIDLDRSAAAARGLAAKPQDAMQAKWSAPLREEPWHARVVVKVTYFVRTDDYCADALPYERIAEEAAVPVTPGLAPDAALAQAKELIWEALDLLREVRPAWYDANIAGELARRAVEVDAEAIDDQTAAAGSAEANSSGGAPMRSPRKLVVDRGHLGDRADLRRVDLSVSFGQAARVLQDLARRARGDFRRDILLVAAGAAAPSAAGCCAACLSPPQADRPRAMARERAARPAECSFMVTP